MKLTLSAVLALFVISAGATDAFSEAAIYFSQNPNGGWAAGWTYNEKTGMEAAQNAEERCQRNGGSNCLVAVEVFNNFCAALAVQSGGNGWALRTHQDIQQARRNALTACNKMGVRCEMKGSFCDTVKEKFTANICVHPVFREEQKLRATIDGTPQTTEKVAAAINYLHQKYCRTVELEDRLQSIDSEHLGDNCTQDSGYYQGELVYWGACYE